MLRSHVVSVSLALAVLVSAPTLASETGSAALATDKKPDDDPNATICKTFKVTGSRLARERVCLTKQQWEAEHHQLEQQMKVRAASGDPSS